jgi:ubiquinone/menaquinone biosynthesis C-methylase UbiE
MRREDAMGTTTTRQATRSPAETYDELFVPALFHQWGPVVADAARVEPGQRVLDVACGTGALTLAIAERAGPTGSVAALDANRDMLAVARRHDARIDWREGNAESLPFQDASFDAVVSQFGLMFFDDKPRALAEMMRVVRRGGRIAVAVWDALERSPGYAALAGLLERLFGKATADAFRAPYVLGDELKLRVLAGDAGIPNPQVQRCEGVVRFASIASLVATERACAWTLGGQLDDEQFTRLIAAAETALAPFVTKLGTVTFATPALLMTARRA